MTTREFPIRRALLLLAAVQLSAQVPYGQAPVTNAGIGHAREKAATAAQAKVFPKLMCGDGWETEAALLNMGTTPLSFRHFFRNQEGLPMTPAPAHEGTLAPNSTATLIVCDGEGPLREAWSLISYDAAQGRLGGYAVLRRRSGGFTFEAAIPLSNMQDFTSYVPFDNTQGFRTQLTLLNPATNLAAQVRLNYLNVDGEPVLIDSLVLKPGQQVTLVLSNTYPDLANKTGTALIEANIDRFCVTGLRYNAESGAIAPLPPVN